MKGFRACTAATSQMLKRRFISLGCYIFKISEMEIDFLHMRLGFESSNRSLML